MFKQILLGKAGQVWKFFLGLALMLVGVFFIKSGIAGKNFFEMNPFALSVMGMGISFLGLAFPCITIFCPKCKVRLMWWAMRKEEFTKWGQGAIFAMVNCPKCGYDGNDQSNAKVATQFNLTNKQSQN